MAQRSRAFDQVIRAGFLAACMLGFSGAAFASDDCANAPKIKSADARHWHYHFDRAHHRKCWFPDKSEVIPSAKELAATEIGAVRVEKQSSWPFPLSLLLPEPATPPPPETAVVEPSTNSAPQGEPATVPNHGGTSQKQQNMAPVPPKRVAAHKAEQRSAALWRAPRRSNSSIDPVKRDALFQAYLHWNDRQRRREGLVNNYLQGNEQQTQVP
jgi:hypothetical protein